MYAGHDNSSATRPATPGDHVTVPPARRPPKLCCSCTPSASINSEELLVLSSTASCLFWSRYPQI